VIVPIVEGDAEVEAVPLLLRKVLHGHDIYDVGIARAKNAHGVGNLRAQGGDRNYLEKFLRYACTEPQARAVLVLLDADSDRDCPPRLARSLAARARTLSLPLPVAVVVASPGYESWLIAGVDRLAGRELVCAGGTRRPGISIAATLEGDPEAVADPKGWLSDRMPPGTSYKETMDQPAMTARIDVHDVAARSRSFAHFVRGLMFLVDEARCSGCAVNPAP
jgi:hypothetical protein